MITPTLGEGELRELVEAARQRCRKYHAMSGPTKCEPCDSLAQLRRLLFPLAQRVLAQARADTRKQIEGSPTVDHDCDSPDTPEAERCDNCIATPEEEVEIDAALSDILERSQ